MNSCVVCEGVESAVKFPGILHCPGCGTMKADLSLSDEELARLYSKNYFFGEEYSDYLKDRAVLEKNFRLRLKVLNSFLNPSHRDLLEIGSAYGFFLNLVKERFKTVQGFDLSQSAVEYAKEQLHVDARCEDFLKHDFGSERFDAVCLWDTIEHLRDPHLYIEKISRLTRKGGLIAMTTGDIESVNAKWRGAKWRLMHPPTHLYYFSKRSLARLLTRHGYEVVYHRYGGFYRSLDNTFYNILVLRQKNKPFYDFLKKTGFSDVHFYLNLFDIMYVVARKI